MMRCRTVPSAFLKKNRSKLSDISSRTTKIKPTPRQFSELTETFLAGYRRPSSARGFDDFERRIALTQISETQDVIQKKIDEANEWLARRAG